MTETTSFGVTKARLRQVKPFYIGIIKGVNRLYPVVFNILTVLKCKTPYIAAKKNKKSMDCEEQAITAFSGSESPGIAYIAIKKMIKDLTFRICCARNTLYEKKMKQKSKWRYKWVF